MLLLIFSGAWHKRIGMKIVPEECVHSEGYKVVSVTLNHSFSTAVAISGACAVLKIGIQS
jgi:succinate dehydrogenase hydrophobic anchor subunit